MNLIRVLIIIIKFPIFVKLQAVFLPFAGKAKYIGIGLIRGVVISPGPFVLAAGITEPVCRTWFSGISGLKNRQELI